MPASAAARSEAGVHLPHVCEHNSDDGAYDDGDSQHREQDSQLSPPFKRVASHANLVVAQVRCRASA